MRWTWKSICREILWAVVAAFFVMYFWNHSVVHLFYGQTVLPLDYEHAFCLYCLVRTLIGDYDEPSVITINAPPRRDWNDREPVFSRR